uniref:NADH-ubiquinone oxidoreductase chain 2 n=1 Tax=Macrosaldula sp. PJ-2017 TaxID=2021942 RepID=A0A343ISC6_9HEMI|nr:NADH dehydrogenase subunit 2 [Macrosaldula sp. PJ-2017]AST10151.1 NADH dehydrogenase subunit 2 [Macrosaldula sp. PJ-2017]
MMKNSSKMLFLIMLFLSTTIVISSDNWLAMWIGMEINLMSFIPSIAKSKNNFSSEACMMYFLVQTMGSIVLLASILLSPMIMISPIMMDKMVAATMMISVLIKMGMSPFHMWVPEIMEKMSWNNCLLLMTWQKIAPMMVLTNLLPNKNFIMLPVILSTVAGAIGGLNQTSMRKIMAYSSISHSGWMVACMNFEHKMWMMYFMIYSVMNMMVINMFNKNSIFYINQMQMYMTSMFNKTNYFIMMMSLGGLPPFLGFLPKWMVIQTMMSSNLYMPIILMMMMSLITLFYYLRMMTTLMMINADMNKWIMNESSKSNIYIFIMNMSLPMVAIFSFF